LVMEIQQVQEMEEAQLMELQMQTVLDMGLLVLQVMEQRQGPEQVQEQLTKMDQLALQGPVLEQQLQ